MIEVVLEESHDSTEAKNKESLSKSLFLRTVMEASDERECSGQNLAEEMKENFLDLSEHDTKILLGLNISEEEKEINDQSKRDDI